ncbi:HAMP domain-containing sensor histidine kinase [Sphingomonas sp. I4]
MRRFTADAWHQMRTPLAVLKVQVALARRGSPAALGEIADAADRLEHLVTQLLSLARAQEAGVAPPRERVDLREVAVAVVNRRIAQAIKAGVEIDLDAPAKIVIASLRTLLFEILSNLLDNVIRYNRRGGHVMLTVTDEVGEGVRIVVADDGPNLPESELARLGERFMRLSTARDSEGAGWASPSSVPPHCGSTPRWTSLTRGRGCGSRWVFRSWSWPAMRIADDHDRPTQAARDPPPSRGGGASSGRGLGHDAQRR